MTASQSSQQYVGSVLPGRTPSRRVSMVCRLVRWSLLVGALTIMVILVVASWSGAGDHQIEPVGHLQGAHRMS